MQYKCIPKEVLAILTYDYTAPGCVVGGDSMHRHNAGYYTVCIANSKYLAHRLVWALHYGDPGNMTVDHKDTDRTNNRVENLRIATKAQQMYNQPMTVRNTTGVKGLSWCNTRNLWVGQVRANGRTHKLRSASRQEVEAWLTSKRAELHKEFAHG